MALWGFWRTWPRKPEITVAHGKPSPQSVVVHRSRALTRDQVVRRNGIVVTSASRTIIDVAPRMNDRRLARTIDDALRTGLLSRSALLRQLERQPNHAGIARVRAAISTEDGPSRSDWERAFPAFCKRHGLPRPRLNTSVCGYEVDALFTDEKLIVELDGWAFHASRAAFEKDRERDAETLRAGFATLRITWRRITQTPVEEAQRLDGILAARRAQVR
jgi:very-short-patch-repair endonuclease